MNARYASPLRYPGGKARMAGYLADLFIHQYGSMDIEIWIEPFAGGAGAGLTLLEAGVIGELWLVEKNPAVAALWAQITSNGEEFARRVEVTTPSMDLWSWSREVIAAGAGDKPGDLGYAAFVINRCSRSGIINAVAGPMGGKNQTGQWHVGSRFNAVALADRIRTISQQRSSIRVMEGDATIYIEGLDDCGFEDEVVLFVDPPYIREGNRLYAHGMSADQHQGLADALHRCPARWMLTYDDEPAVLDLYPGHRVLEYEIPHTANKQRIDKEYAVVSDNLGIDPQRPLLPRSTSTWVQGQPSH